MNAGNEPTPQADLTTPDPEVEALLFDAACVFPGAAERDRFLGFACRGEPEMLGRIQSLIGMSAPAEDFFEFEPQMAAAVMPPDADGGDGLGVDVGRYRLIERIGSGGCGVVYLAEQREPVRRKVALKIIRLGLENTESAAGFDSERQALASMNHPNIARILDGGTTESGRAYYVMELVDGEAITTFCDSRRIGIRKRMEWFLDVCRAIQHAHQKSVVHRDIKPTNILMDATEPAPVPKVIDFGIARKPGLPDGATDDHAIGLTGTPVYMSPEQAAGNEPVDTRSDIYSLGVLLGELLVGPSTPLPSDLMERGIEEIRKILLDVKLQAPSVILASRGPAEREFIARNRSVSADRLLAWCRHDLDWVVRKAVERDPSRRYATVEALAADVARWLHDEPVAARPPSRRYRLAKLVNRNRLWFGAGALAFVGLVGGLGVATVLFFRERDARAVQERMRLQAEAAHDAEKHARTGWENRSRVAESAVRLRYQDFTGAEELVAPIPVEETPPSLEAVGVFKQLAQWNRDAGRMEPTARHYLSMVSALANIDRAHTDSNSDSFLPAATALALSADPQGYETLRRIALDLYENTEYSLVAERTLKACLLKPAPEAVLVRTRKLVKVLETEAAGESAIIQDPRGLGAWMFLAIALHHYRDGDHEAAESWALRALKNSGPDPSCPPMTRAVLGLACLSQGNREEAASHLAAAEAAARAHAVANLPHGGHPTGFWWDWANLRILLDEAAEQN